MTLYLVRHADAKSRANWGGDDLLRPLTKKGERQVHGVLELLHDATVGRVLTSPSVRCVDTVAPIAAKAKVPVEIVDELLEGAPTAKAYDLLLEQCERRDDSVLCTHGDIVPELLRALARDGVRFDSEPRWAKGSTWVITVKAGRPSRARYVPPLER